LDCMYTSWGMSAHLYPLCEALILESGGRVV
jgi:hypothetical protein